MLLVEFALAYGNDWFVVPIELDVGSVYRTRSLSHHRYVRCAHADQVARANWATPHSHVANVPAFLHARRAGSQSRQRICFSCRRRCSRAWTAAPIEEVLFLRDEMANLAWAVERLVESPAERPLNRFEAVPGQQRRE